MIDLSFVSSPLVTVGIPIFNGENDIFRVISLLLDQDYENIEILCSDNCSTDNSRGLIQDLILKNKNIRLISSESNNGALANINALFTNAQGKYMLLASLDDSWSRDFITNAVKAMEISPDASLCIPRVSMCLGPQKTVVYSIRLKDDFFSGNTIRRFWRSLSSFPSAGWYGLYRVSEVRRIGLIPICFAGDLIFLQKLSLVSKFIYSGNSILTFTMRKNWNSRKQDLAFFYGDTEKPSLLVPFLVVLKGQFSSILRIDLPVVLKFAAFIQVLLNLAIKKPITLIMRSLSVCQINSRYKMWLLRKLHQLFFQPNWMIIKNQDAFLDKEVYGRFGVK